MNLATHYRLAEGVAVRSERFGGLVYRYDNRRLYFLHSRDVADFVSGLDGLRPLQTALGDFLESRGLPAKTGETLVKTVTQLEKMGILVPAPADVSKAHTQAHSHGGGQDVESTNIPPFADPAPSQNATVTSVSIKSPSGRS